MSGKLRDWGGKQEAVGGEGCVMSMWNSSDCVGILCPSIQMKADSVKSDFGEEVVNIRDGLMVRAPKCRRRGRLAPGAPLNVGDGF